MFANAYRGKRVLVTGHTGFKGAWLSSWLLKLGAIVAGLSDSIPTTPAAFEVMNLEEAIHHISGDVRDLDTVKRAITDFKPDFIFHLAAQAIVSRSYQNPLETITTNVVGTATLLEALRLINPHCTAVIITSDKCYENVEWIWGYKETDQLGGRDIYSGSKGAAEIIFHSYYHSFFLNKENRVKLATGRAGNVIGGGDWAKDRIVADCVRNWADGRPVEIRSPTATRPWQHVLEPLSGYLWLGSKLAFDLEYRGESFNFGPRSEQNHTVLELLNELAARWQFSRVEDAYRITDNIPFHEAGLLKLNCDKALTHLKWHPTLTYHECVHMVSDWYYKFYRESVDMRQLTLAQIASYEERATERSLAWAC